MALGIGGHQKSVGDSDIWLTPRSILDPLGEFDLDPAASSIVEWPIAKTHFTKNGLERDWFGRVWLNPPYNRYHIWKWLNKMAIHNNGIALTSARTETDFFQSYIFPFADSILFIKGRITFHNQYGKLGRFNSGAPSVLIGYGEYNSDVLSKSGIEGKHVTTNNIPVMVVTISPAWRHVIDISITRMGGKSNLQKIYDMVEIVAPDKVKKNPHFKEKVRQTLQKHFERIKRGEYAK